MEENTDESFVEDAADIDARRMAMKAAEGVQSRLIKGQIMVQTAAVVLQYFNGF